MIKKYSQGKKVIPMHGEVLNAPKQADPPI